MGEIFGRVLVHVGDSSKFTKKFVRELGKKDGVKIVLVLDDTKPPKLLSDNRKDFIVVVSTSSEMVEKIKNECDTKIFHIDECDDIDSILETAKA